MKELIVVRNKHSRVSLAYDNKEKRFIVKSVGMRQGVSSFDEKYTTFNTAFKRLKYITALMAAEIIPLYANIVEAVAIISGVNFDVFAAQTYKEHGKLTLDLLREQIKRDVGREINRNGLHSAIKANYKMNFKEFRKYVEDNYVSNR